MVRLLRLQAHNFKKLRLESPIQFGDGITLITGLNEAGKSSVLDAILYALFGRVTRPIKAKNEDLIRYGANEAKLSLDFEVDERTFRVTRNLHKTKPTKASLDELKPSRPSQPLATGQEKVNEEIVRLLGGITYHEIISSTVVAQKELNKLIELNKDDRKRIINAFLNLESFNVVTVELSEERKDLEGTSSRVGKLQAEKEKLEVLTKELEVFRRNGEEKVRIAKENSALADESRDLQSRFQLKDRLYSDLRQYEAVMKAKENLHSQLSGKRKLLEDYESHGQRLTKEIDDVRAELAKFGPCERVEPSIPRVQEQLEQVKIQFLELSSAERSRKTVESEVGELDRKLASVETLGRAAQINRPILPYVLLSVLLFAGGFGALVVGLFPVAVGLILVGLIPAAIAGSRIRATTSLAKNQSMLGDLRFLESKKRELAAIETQRQQAKQKFDSTERELATLCETLLGYNDVFRSANSLGTMEKAQKIIQAFSRDKQARDALQVKMQTLSDEVRKLPSQQQMSLLEIEVQDLEKQVKGLVFPGLPEGITFGPRVLAETMTARDELSRQLTTSQNRIQQNLQRIQELDMYLTEHADIVSRVQSQEQVVGKLDRQLRVVRRAVESVQATSESLRNRIRPSVQGYMGAILPALTSSKYRAAVLDDDYNLQVWDPEAGEYRPRDVYSGGTEDQFLLAMRLAFALALLPEVKGQKPEFVFLDEPLSSSDEIRRSEIVNYLAQDLARKFKQIFIISHVGGLEEQVQNIIALDDGRIVSAESL